MQNAKWDQTRLAFFVLSAFPTTRALPLPEAAGFIDMHLEFYYLAAPLMGLFFIFANRKMI